MNHDPFDKDGERELFARLEADMTGGPAGAAAPVIADPDDGEPSVYVDGPAPAAPARLEQVKGARRRPILPKWAKDKAEFKTAATWLARHYAHTFAFHAVRVPLYAAKLTGRAPRGFGRIAGGVARWSRDAEAAPLRAAAVAEENAELYLKLLRQRDARVLWRRWALVIGAAFGAAFAAVLWVMTPGWTHLALFTAALLALGMLGAPADRPLIERAVTKPKAQRLTSDIVLRALGALSISQINQAQAKGRDGFTFTAPITRDGPGWRAEGDLPYGVTVSDVMDRRDRLASGLRRPLGCVWPEAVPDEHTGHLVLWVGDQDMNKARQPKWPLLTSGAVDVFKPQPFATDQRGRWVEQGLVYISGVIGAVPRMGKTFLLRLLGLIAAMDPRVELHPYDLKGTGDLSALERCAHRYRAGDEEDDIEYAVTDLRAVRTELRRRAKVIRNLPKDLCPESKVTSALADNKSLGLHPIVILVDECQVWFEHPKYGAELEEHCTDIVKRGPALGITLLLATQRPDSKSLPTGISANATVRWCLKVMGQIENDMVLGTGAYKRGVRANMLAWADKGICYFAGEGSDARIVRSVYVDAPTADAVALRAYKLRKDAGTLSGHALGEQPEGQAVTTDLAADILAVVPEAEAKVWSETVTERLAQLRPQLYDGWGPDQLTAALKPLGIETVQIGRRVDGKFVNRRGIERQHIAALIAQRNRNQGGA